jgi:hypothetical protein
VEIGQADIDITNMETVAICGLEIVEKETQPR